MICEYNSYLTFDRSLDIEFLFVEIAPSNWRIYILTDIDYGSRCRDASVVHRLTEENSTLKTKVKHFVSALLQTVLTDPVYYVCWTKTIPTLDTAHNIASSWADITAYYIAHGGTFPAIQKTLSDLNVI